MSNVRNIAEPSVFERAARLIREPSRALYGVWKRIFRNTPFPMRLPFGAWWLAGDDYSGTVIRRGGFENSEYSFVRRYLEPGMTVLDIGAHHGFYTLLASTRVGREGRVHAFEPSPRERAALLRHLRWNRRRNVSVNALALGKEANTAQLFVVDQNQTGCNSLRPPASDVHESCTPMAVDVVTLDSWFSGRDVRSVDFVKLDVEGGELDVLKGASAFLDRRPRPVFLVEVQDVRTENWGYPAKEIISFLAVRGFRWFSLLPDGSLSPLNIDSQRFEGNYVAWPEGHDVQRLATFVQNS